MSKSPISHRSRSPEYALLGFLYLQPGHGYDLHRRLVDELGQTWHVSQSQTYAILKRLEAQGWISSNTVQQEKLPAIQALTISHAGRQRFKIWLDTPTGSSVRAMRVEFITRLYFAQELAPEKILPMLETQTSEIRAALARLDANLAALPDGQKFNRLSLQLRIRQLGCILEWLVECREAFGSHPKIQDEIAF
jgi:PadR family transcriptional regulator, regulatory protein AphA